MFKKAIIAGALLAAVAGANAQSAGFGVIGTINPNACTLTLSGGGVADYGTQATVAVQARSVYLGAYNLGVKTIPLAVTCGSAIAVELAFVDNRSAQLFALGDGYDAIRYGIGNGAATTPFGTYDLTTDGLTIDGAAPAVWLSAPTGTTTWATTVVGGASAVFAQPGHAVGFGKVAGATVPSTLTTIGGVLNINARVSKAAVDAATGAMTLNGSGTISLQYL